MNGKFCEGKWERSGCLILVICVGGIWRMGGVVLCKVEIRFNNVVLGEGDGGIIARNWHSWIENERGFKGCDWLWGFLR